MIIPGSYGFLTFFLLNEKEKTMKSQLRLIDLNRLAFHLSFSFNKRKKEKELRIPGINRLSEKKENAMRRADAIKHSFTKDRINGLFS